MQQDFTDAEAPITRPDEAAVRRAIELRRNERYVDAQHALDEVRGDAGDLARRLALAERARLAYYAGEFERGVALAQSARTTIDEATLHAGFALGLNLLALNRGADALAAINEALLHTRLLASVATEVIDGLVLLAHVQAHTGRHRDAINTAHSAVVLASQPIVDSHDRARAEYAYGFALMFGGREDALSRLVAAERLARSRGGSLWRWVLFCIALELRDRGFAAGASQFLARSTVALRYERAWFGVRRADFRDAASWLRARVASDERPYARTVVAAIRARCRVQAKPLPGLTRAIAEFQHGGLDHWRWGALWIRHAQVSDASGFGALLDELQQRQILKWGFFDPVVARSAIRRTPIAHPYAQQVLCSLRRDSTASDAQPQLLLSALQVVNPEALAEFAVAGLAPSEIRVLLAALHLWFDRAAFTRADLARDLNLQESSVRSTLNRIRMKLGIEHRRGVEPILAWLAERELLAPSATSRVIARLAS